MNLKVLTLCSSDQHFLSIDLLTSFMDRVDLLAKLTIYLGLAGIWIQLADQIWTHINR